MRNMNEEEKKMYNLNEKKEVNEFSNIMSPYKSPVRSPVRKPPTLNSSFEVNLQFVNFDFFNFNC